jgi:hypothetical protein
MRAFLIVFVVGLLLPAVALAHGGAAEQDYTSTVDHIVGANGVEAEASGDGQFSFTAPAGHAVVVRGYYGEPYLRFAGGKVFENERAPSTFVNRDEPPPQTADAKAAPKWVRVADGRTYEWTERRTHWMAAQPPAVVRQDPNQAHHIFDWNVGGTVDGKPFEIVGSLDWGPTPSGPGYEWISFIVIGGGVLYAAFLLFAKQSSRRVRRAGSRA